MATPAEKQSLIDKCVELRRNDLSVTSLDLGEYGKLDWDDTSHIAESLVNNTRVRELIISLSRRHLTLDGMDSSIPLLLFLSTSPSLQSLAMREESTPFIYSHSTTYILQAISHNKLLVKLELDSLVYAKPSLVENLFAKTLTLEELKVTEGNQSNTEVYHAFRRGFERNNSMKSLNWVSSGPSPDLGEVFFGLSNHPKLKRLLLDVKLTPDSSQALQSCLHTNETIDHFSLRLQPPTSVNEDEWSTLTPILLGLAGNRGVTHFYISNSVLSGISCATSWVEMLQKNTSIKILDLYFCSIGREDMSAIARGLEGNASLEKLQFKCLNGDSILDGPAWQAMLQRNRSLKGIELLHGSLTGSEIPSDEFACFVGGLVQNASLKSLDLSGQCIGTAGIVALVEALGSNHTLESLDLYSSGIEGADGTAAVQNLWRNKTLKHLSLSDDVFFEDDEAFTPATWFPTDLSRNCFFETLNLQVVGLKSRGCRAVCESLQENSCLRRLNLSNNDIFLDVDCVTALNELLGSTTLRSLHIGNYRFANEGIGSRGNNRVTNEGIELLARGLHGNSSLRELGLQGCEISKEGLLNLGEALIENSALETLALTPKDAFGEDGVSQFFQLLPKMEGLKNLCLKHCNVMVNEELCVAVVDGLRKNTSLQRLTWFDGERESPWYDEAPSHVKPLISFYLNLNRKGRKLLEGPLASRVPVGLWPHILANLSSPKDTSLLFYFLRKKASLVIA